jgi:threonine/homoserine/homoserine lactone efflux protein
VSVVGTLLVGAVFGLVLAAPPGPMNAIIAEESVVRGWTAGVRAGAGALLADFSFFVLAWLGVVGVVRRFPRLQASMVGVGGVLMLYFAYGAAREAGLRRTFRATNAPPERDGSAGRTTGFQKAFLLALTNPYQILFWLTIGVGLLDPGLVDVLAQAPYVGGALDGLLVVRTGSAALVTGFFAGIVVWVTAFPAALVVAERRAESFAPLVAGLSAVVLGGFGVSFLFEAARTLL